MRFSNLPPLLAAGLLALCVGCAAPRVGKSLSAELPKDDPDSQLEFWHRLGEMPMATHDDAFHGLLLYTDGQDPSPDYAARVVTLKSRNVLPASFDRPADEAIDRGTLAVALVKVIDLKGGLLYTLTAAHPRYAVRELMYQGLYPPSSPNQTFSGSEYVGIIGRLEDYQRGNPADKPAARLPGDPPEQSAPKESASKGPAPKEPEPSPSK